MTKMINKAQGLVQNVKEFMDRPSFAQQSLSMQSAGKQDVRRYGKVAVIFGGRSSERKISLESGNSCLESLLRSGVDAYPIDPDDDLAINLRLGKFDRAFIMLHGKEGEDGIVQGTLQMMGLPFTGSGVAASALAMNKSRAKLVMHGLDVPTPVFGVAYSLEQANVLAKKIGLPVSVKPVNEGSSIGVTRVEDMAQLANAYARAAIYGEVMIEQWIDGADFFVSVLGDQVLPAVKVKPANGFYDYNAKYESNKTQYLCPPPISKEQERELADISYRAFKALGCEGWGRVDLVQDKEGNFWVLEVNTIPGMTSHSLVPMSALAQGMSFDDLVMAILTTTLNENQMSVGNLAQL